MTNQKEKRKVPELRFPEFSGEWKVKKLKDISQKNTNKNKTNSITNVISNSAAKGLIKQLDFFEKEIANSRNLEGYYIIKKDDYVYNPRISNFAPYGPINRYKLEDDGIISPLYMSFSINNEINDNFIEYYFKSSKWHKHMYMNGDSGARHDRISIKDNEFFSMELYLPNEDEQQKIGEFFSKLDRQIELEEKKLALLDEQKKGYMQKIFSQELRFKDENGEEYPEWGVIKIEDILIFENNKRKPITSEYRKKGVFPYYGATGQIDYIDGYLFEDKRLLIGEDGANWAKYQKSSFICEGKYWVNNHAHVTYSNNNNIHFIMNILNYMELRNYITGNAPGKLTLDNLKKIKISLPNLKEQNKISDFFKVMDQMIYMGNKKIDKLKLQKDSILKKVII